jgi:hypothetical protein
VASSGLKGAMAQRFETPAQPLGQLALACGGWPLSTHSRLTHFPKAGVQCRRSGPPKVATVAPAITLIRRRHENRVRQRTDIAAAAEDHQCHLSRYPGQGFAKEMHMNRIVYIVGFVVIVIFVLGFLGLR